MSVRVTVGKSPTDATTVLREYGQAIRGDWSDVDGRGVRADLDTLADWIDSPDTAPSLTQMRDRVGVCPAGNGHWSGDWYGYCTAACTDKAER
jgi:hypothetical protein